MPVAKEQIIADNNISNVANAYTLLWDGFKDILQELVEAELNATLGYERTDKILPEIREWQSPAPEPGLPFRVHGLHGTMSGKSPRYCSRLRRSQQHDAHKMSKVRSFWRLLSRDFRAKRA